MKDRNIAESIMPIERLARRLSDEPLERIQAETPKLKISRIVISMDTFK